MIHIANELETVKQSLINDHYILLNAQLKITSFSGNCVDFCKKVLKVDIKDNNSISSLLINAKEDLSIIKIQKLLLESNTRKAKRIRFSIGNELLGITIREVRQRSLVTGYSCIFEHFPQQKEPNDIFENMHLINSLTWFTSHKLRGPLAAILGLIEQNPLLEIINPQRLENLLVQMKQQATNLDDALHTLNNLLSSNNYTSPAVTKLAAKDFKNILLLDDELLLHKICVKIVAEINPQIKTFCFTDGNEALEFLDSFPIDLILLDINMPIMNGWEFLDNLRKKGVKTSTIIVSSSIDNKDVNRSFEYKNVKGFINKPINKDDLKSILYNSIPLTYA